MSLAAMAAKRTAGPEGELHREGSVHPSASTSRLLGSQSVVLVTSTVAMGREQPGARYN